MTVSDGQNTALLLTPCWTAVTCRDCDVPGYLIVLPVARVHTLEELPAAAQKELGHVLAVVERAVVAVTGAERIYLLRFGESRGGLHFHVFPRTKDIAEQWRRSSRDLGDELIGESIFAWARTYFRVAEGRSLSTATLVAAQRISNLMGTIESGRHADPK